MPGSEGLETRRTWRDELPSVNSVVNPEIAEFLRESVLNGHGQLDPKIISDFANRFFADFAGHTRIEEMIALLVIRSAIQGTWVTVMELDSYSDRTPEGLADYHAQLIAESYGLIKQIRPDSRGEFDTGRMLQPTKLLLQGVTARLNGDMTRKVTPESQF